MESRQDPIDKAIKWLWDKRIFQHGERQLTVACLIRNADWKPLRSAWWRKKEACIIGADLDGNFFLRCSDGTVRLWDHKAQADEILAPSVKQFVAMLE